MRGRAASVFANPVLVGAVTVLVVIVAVFLSYNANKRPAVRPDDDAEGARRQRRRTSSRATRSARAAPRRRRRRHAPVRLADGQTGAELKLKLDKTIGDVPEDSTLAHPPALGARPEVPRARPRALSKHGVPGRRHGPGSQADRRQRRPRRGLQDVRRQDARGQRRRTCAASATRSPAAARPSGARSRSCRALLRPPRAGDAQPRRPGHRPARLLQASSATPRASSRRSPSSNARAVHVDGRHVRGARRATREALKPIDRQVAADDGRGDRVVPRPAPVPRRPDRVLARTSRARPHELRGALPTLNRALETGTPVQQRVPRAQRRARKTLDARRATSPRRRRPTPRCAALTATVTTLNPQLRFYGPFVTVCNSLELLLHLPRRALLRARQHRLGAARAAQLRRPAGRLARRDGRRRAGQRQGRQAGQRRSSLQDQPYGAAITPDGRADCEAGQRGYVERNARFYAEASTRSTGPAHAGRPGPDLHGPRARAEGRDVHGRARRPARTRTCPRPRAVSDEAPARRHEHVHASACRARRDRCVGVYLGFTKSIPFQPPLRGQGGVRELEQPAAGLAGADRRRRGRQGHEDRARARRAATGAIVTMRITGQGPAAARRRARQDPPAHLPRGQLLRRPHARHAVGAGARRRPRRSRSTRPPRRCSSTRC